MCALRITHYSFKEMNAQIKELTLTAFTYGGDALGRLEDGRAVFVPFGLPGERVRIRITEERRGYARGELVEILQAAPERIEPRCKHFGTCGGCHYQHLPYEAQLRVKTEILRDQLQRIGGIEDPPVGPMAACPSQWNYRNQVQFHLTREGKIGYVRVGLPPPLRSSGASRRPAPTVIPISECHLPDAAINGLWPQLDFEPGMNIERVSIRAGMEDELMLVLEADTPEAPELEIEAGISVAHVFGEQSIIIAGEDHIYLRVLDRDFYVSAPSFFQVNTAMAAKMVQHILTNLPISQSTLLLDVYCGAGLFSAFLASKCRRLIGIESSSSACEDFAINLDEFENVELYEDSAEHALPSLDVQPDIVLVDPPRAGLERAALDAIVQMNPATIVYVSCDPSTLARDAARFIKGGYRLRDVTPFDLFPQTYHIESISLFER